MERVCDYYSSGDVYQANALRTGQDLWVSIWHFCRRKVDDIIHENQSEQSYDGARTLLV